MTDNIGTICGCTKAGMLAGSQNPCYGCGHANGNHNMGKGCRITWSPEYNHFYLEDTDVDYSKFKRLMK